MPTARSLPDHPTLCWKWCMAWWTACVVQVRMADDARWTRSAWPKCKSSIVSLVFNTTTSPLEPLCPGPLSVFALSMELLPVRVGFLGYAYIPLVVFWYLLACVLCVPQQLILEIPTITDSYAASYSACRAG